MLLQGSWQAQGLRQTNAGGNGFGDQLVQGVDADTFEHGVDILRSRTQMAGGKRRLDMMDRSVILRCKGKEPGDR